MLKLFSIFIKNINNHVNFLLIIKKLDLSTLSTLLSTLEPKKGSFFKHAQPQTKKLCAYKKKVYTPGKGRVCVCVCLHATRTHLLFVYQTC